MAEASGHKWGQFIGEFCESAIEPLLQAFAVQHGLFLDKKGIRPARPGKKLNWMDSFGNSHDLDYVLERDGAPEKIGTPIAFFESAWRRYTKHSRNKAQEIQGPLVRYEVVIRYDYRNKIEGQFQDKPTTIEFLSAYQDGNWKPLVDER